MDTKTFFRSCLIAAALGIAVSLPTSALAQAVSCSEITSLDTFEAAESCTLADKTFTFVDANFDASLDFSSLGSETQVLFQGFSPVLVGPSIDLYFDYTVETSSPWFFKQVQVDSTGAQASGAFRTVTKEISDDGGPIDTITSVNGAIASSILLSPRTYLQIHETLYLTEGAQINGVNNTFIQAVPEPEIYAMLAAGLGLMGFVARRRKQQLVAA